MAKTNTIPVGFTRRELMALEYLAERDPDGAGKVFRLIRPATGRDEQSVDRGEVGRVYQDFCANGSRCSCEIEGAGPVLQTKIDLMFNAAYPDWFTAGRVHARALPRIVDSEEIEEAQEIAGLAWKAETG